MKVVNITESLEGKFGPQLKDDKGQYYSFSKFYKGETKLAVGAYSMDIYVTAKGNNYINSLEAVAGSVTVAPAVSPKRGRPAKAKAEMAVAAPVNVAPKGRDFDAEARGKTRCALVEALFSNPNVVQDVAGLKTEPLFLLVDEAVDYIFGEKKVS